ncbi:MAG TPA: Rieske 2Fe-2S domain-containing protein, partial [Candidatus Saccharimonadia bacterium]|nr:Rieske 2Fe-2S domain-containing protein [Candidatus Saccharimonadia bacterium]
LSREENEMLTRVGPGTPCGELMRRYWHPVAATVQLADNPVRKVRILGEDLVLFRDRSGNLGLIEPRCPHRAMHMAFGIPEEVGLRCPYHGWLFDGTGRCLEQPLAPPDSTFKDRVRIAAYQVQEMGGLVWAYLGPEPVPLLPRLDLCERDQELRQIVGHMLPCNWLQVMENRGDQPHAIYLHGRLFQYALERQRRLTDDPAARYNATMHQQADRMQRGVYPIVQIVPNKYGFTKGMRDSDAPEDVWQLGGPVFFPYLVYPNGGNSGSIRHDYQLGVPIDDTTTWHISYRSYTFPPEVTVPRQERIPYVEVPIQDENGEYILDYVLGQDMVAWYEQGEITDRTKEHLYEGDKVVIAYRQMLKEQIEIVQRGGDPMNIMRDPAEHIPWVPTLEGWPVATIEAATRTSLPWRQRTTSYRFNFHKMSKAGWKYIEDDVDRYCTDRELILKLYEEADRLMHR